MNDPIKVIFKYKNNNRRVQYHMYIFVGNIPNNIYPIEYIGACFIKTFHK